MLRLLINSLAARIWRPSTYLNGQDPSGEVDLGLRCLSIYRINPKILLLTSSKDLLLFPLDQSPATNPGRGRALE